MSGSESYRNRDKDRDRYSRDRESDRYSSDRYDRDDRDSLNSRYRERSGDRHRSRSRERERSRDRRHYYKDDDRRHMSSRIDSRIDTHTGSTGSHTENHSHSHTDNHSHSHTYTHKPPRNYDPPTTESLHARKLAALDHESFLMDRQAKRDAATLNGEGKYLLWPRTPERGEYYFGDFKEEEWDDNEADKDIETMNNGTNLDDTTKDSNILTETPITSTLENEDNLVIKVKAPSASKPSINSFSTAKPAKYGSDLMPGEGTAMAGFVASGQRIPRRGEIGLDSSEITRFESAGYVMSGSRHHLMNAVRMRKENQVISAEEKRMISQMAIEERIKREEEIVKTFKSMVDEKLKQKQNK